jgi:ribose-phosphate pyrophosphokinase
VNYQILGYNMESLIYLLSDGREDLLEAIIATTNDLELGDELKRGNVLNQSFSDNEMCSDFLDSVKGKRVYLLSNFDNSDEVIRLNLAIDAAMRAKASEIIPILPYFIYGRGDKRDQPRGPIGAKVMASMLENSGATSIIGFDFHADQIQGFFNIPVDHIEGKNVFVDYVSGIYDSDTILCSPDEGGGKRVKRMKEQLKRDYDIDAKYVMISKTREEANLVSAMSVIGDVQGKNVIIIDDILDTGGTLVKAAETLMEVGAKSVKAVITHGILSGTAIERINNSQLSKVILSDSVKKTSDHSVVNNDRFEIISVSRQIALVIASINYSLSYEELKDSCKREKELNY